MRRSEQSVDELVKQVMRAELWAADAEEEVEKLQEELWEINHDLKQLRDRLDWLLDGKDDGLDITEADVYAIREEVDKLIKF